MENPWLGVSYRPVRWCSAMRETCHSYSFMQLDILLAILLAARWCFTWIYYIKITISLLEDDKQWKLWSIVQWYNHTKAASLNVLSTVLFTWPGSNTAPANIYLLKVDANPAIKRFKSSGNRKHLMHLIFDHYSLMQMRQKSCINIDNARFNKLAMFG